MLPAASRVMHSNLNARLLMQYSNSLGKKTSVVSPDARTQGVAIDTGFDTFPSMAAYESGRSLERAVDARASSTSPIAAGALGAGAVAGIPAGTSRRSTVAPGPVASPRPQPVAARPQTAAAAAAASTVHSERRIGFLPWVLGAVGIFLIAMILLFFVLPSATVTIIVSARPVSINPTITGSTQPPAADQPLAVQTTLQQAQEQQQQQVTSTGQKVIPAVKAQGSVSVGNNGSNAFCCAFTNGNTYEVSTADGKKFIFVPDKNYVVGPGERQDFPIAARAGGTASNVPAHTINSMTNGPPGIIVDNANPTINGVDEQKKTVVGQADIDKVKQQVGDTLTQKVKDDLKNKAGKDTVIADSIGIDVSTSTDKQPGDEVANFSETVTVKGKATTVNDQKVKDLLLAALKRQVISGYHLTDDKPKLDYKEVQHDETGGMVWDGTASGFMATAINDADLRGKISGKSPKEAVTYVQSHLDAKAANVSISPPFVPWLPFISGNIHLREQVENTTPTS
ncbi:MAG: hypothetical protein QOK05_1715 [Chloroflexota bacterium]|nr:hypothetical protein [Chloroflexota bacterium]